jgi:8-oxo-dGTP pyrophosphatase MutT (NUDIX family)
MRCWEIIDSKYLIHDRWLKLRADSCKTPSGTILEPFYILEYSDWVHIVAFDSENKILVSRQYRHGAGKICTEIPCGAVDPGESPIVTAERELLEETGCVCREMTKVLSFYANPASHTNMVHCFAALDAEKKQEPELDDSEEIVSEFIPVSEVLDMIENGEFAQGLHIASILTVLRKLGLDSPFGP